MVPCQAAGLVCASAAACARLWVDGEYYVHNHVEHACDTHISASNSDIASMLAVLCRCGFKISIVPDD